MMRNIEGSHAAAQIILAFTLFVPLVFAQAGVPASVYQHVDACFQQGRFSAAEALLRAALSAHPRDAHALGMLGVVLDAERRYKDAEEYYAKALRLDPHSPSLLNNLGNHYVAQGDFVHARAAYLRVIAINSRHPNANLQLAKICVDSGQGREALHFLAKLPPGIAGQTAVKLLRARALHLTGKTAEANGLLEEIQKEGGSNPRVAFNVGLTEAAWKEYKQAEKSLRIALGADAPNFDVLYNLGLAAINAGDLETARQTLAAAIAQRPDDVDTLYNLAWLESKTGHNDEAIVQLVRAHRLAPKRADVMLLTGQVSENLGFYGDAAQAFYHYLKLEPGDDVVRREYGFALAHTPSIDEAVAVLRTYMARHREDARGFYELGVAESVHEQDRAVQDLKRALALEPGLTAADDALGDVLYRGGQFPQAVRILKPLVDRDPDDYHALDVLGEAELRLDDINAAASDLGRAAQLAPTDRKVLFQYGQVLERAHQHQKALAVLERFQHLPAPSPRPYSGLIDYLSMSPARREELYLEHLKDKMQFNPDDVSLKVQWAKAMLSEGKTNDSSRAFDQVLAHHPGASVLNDCGQALLAHAQYAEATKFFVQAGAADSAQPADLLDLSIAVFHTSGPQAALAKLDLTAPLARHGDYYLLRAQLLDAMGQAQEAANDLTLGLRTDSTRPDLYFEAALFLLKHNQTREVVGLLRQATVRFPNSRQLLLLQAITYGLTHRFGRSIQIMTRIQALWPEWNEAYLIHAIVLVGEAKMREAKPLLETAIAMGSRNPFAYYNLALTDMAILPANVPGAAKAIQTALKLDPNDPYAQSLAGKIAYRQKNYSAALDHLQAAARLWPQMIEAHQTLSATYRALGDKQKSIAELKEVLQIQQRIRAPDQAPPSDLRSLLFSIPVPGPIPSGWP